MWAQWELGWEGTECLAKRHVRRQSEGCLIPSLSPPCLQISMQFKLKRCSWYTPDTLSLPPELPHVETLQLSLCKVEGTKFLFTQHPPLLEEQGV